VPASASSLQQARGLARHDLVRFKDGQIVRGWDSWNLGALLKQLGARTPNVRKVSAVGPPAEARGGNVDGAVVRREMLDGTR